MRTTLSVALMTLLATGLARGQGVAPTGPTIPAAGLIEDVDLLQKIYEAAHPGLHRYNTRPQMVEHFRVLRARFDRDRTLAEAYVAFSEFLAKVRCGHTYANFFNQPGCVAQTHDRGPSRWGQKTPSGWPPWKS